MSNKNLENEVAFERRNLAKMESKSGRLRGVASGMKSSEIMKFWYTMLILIALCMVWKVAV